MGFLTFDMSCSKLNYGLVSLSASFLMIAIVILLVKNILFNKKC